MARGVLREFIVPPALERRFASLLMLSLLLHGSLFAGLAWLRQPPPPALPPLLATLRLAPPVESGPPAVAVVPAAVPTKVRPSPPPRELRPAPRLAMAAGPTIPSAPPVAVASEAAGTPAPVAASAPALPVAAAVVVPPAAPTADLLAAYRRRLGELFASHQDYPRVAALRGWEGEVRLRLRVARKGTLLAVDVDHSSGFTVLDQHALAMLAELGGLPPLPEALGDHEIQVVVPINYKLNKAT